MPINIYIYINLIFPGEFKVIVLNTSHHTVLWVFCLVLSNWSVNWLFSRTVVSLVLLSIT